MMFSLISCQPSGNNTSQIVVELDWHGKALSCESGFSAGSNNSEWAIEQLLFFISDIEVQSQTGDWQKLTLESSIYQTDNLVLLGENCRDSAVSVGARVSEATLKHAANWQIGVLNDALLAQPKKMRFTLGVPFELNHLNPITQASPLNFPAMFWVWQTGHKFMRLELASNDDYWQFHLGSTGCSAASAMRAPMTPCRYPNTVTVELAIAQLTESKAGQGLTIKLSLAKLLSEVMLSQNNGCQSNIESQVCQTLFTNLGINQGSQQESNQPSVFSATFNGAFNE